MVKVECDGCGAPYQIDEKRIPPTGLKMRCPKCGNNLLVQRPGGDATPGARPPAAAPGEADLPAVAAKPPAPPRAGPPRPPPPPRPGAKPPMPAPKPVATLSEIDDLDVSPLSAGSGFGEIDLGVDLPAVSGGTPGNSDLPAVRGRPPAPPSNPKETRPWGGAQDPWGAAPASGGDADLPAVSDGPADLPMPALSQTDFPSPAHPGRPPVAPRRPTVNFGDIDLPAAPSAAQPAGYPAPLAAPPPPRMRGRTVNFGDIDLPSVPEDLPLPMGGGFGELDLPLLAEDAGLPSPGGAGLPAMAESYLPANAYGAGLPMPAQGAGLPMPAGAAGLPMTAQGAGLPMPAQGAGLPMAAQGTGFPMAAQSSGLPMTLEGSGLPAVMDVGLPSRFGEAENGSEIGLDGSAFDDSDRAVPAQMDGRALGAVGIDLAGPPRATVGSEADLGAAPPMGAAAVEALKPAGRGGEHEAAAPKKSKAGRVGVLLGVAVAISGGAMTLVPSLGPFGTHFIIDAVNAKSNAAALDELRRTTSATLDDDTFGAATTAIDRCKTGRASMPRYQPATAYCAYVALDRGLRHGRRTEDEALAKQLLADAANGGDPTVLANAALATVSGQGASSRGTVASLLQRAAGDVDAAVLAADIELADKAAAKEAVAAWTRAVGIHKSARTLFGLARAESAAGDPKAAEADARAALQASPTHAGARILIATLRGGDPAQEVESLAMLKQVTDPGPVADAASEGDRVAAYAQTGTIHLGRSRMSAAEQAFAAALKINPLAVPALIGNGELFYRSGRYAEAQSRFEAAANADPDSIVAKVGIAKTFIAEERMREAKDMLKKLRETNATEPLVSLWLGHAEEVLGNKKEAEAAYLEAIKVGGGRVTAVDAYVALIHLLSGMGRTDDANAKLAEAAKRFPDLPALHRARGELALQLGRYEDARTELEAALAQVDDLGTRFHLGETLRRMRRFDDATMIFDKVAAVDPDYPGLAIEKGVISQETGQSERALELYRKALEKAPNDMDLKLRVGQTQVMAGHPLAAEKILEEVRRARPNSAEANHYLGRVLLSKGENLGEAMRYLEMAVQIDGNRPEYHLYVGWAANDQGQAGKAGPALNKAIELDHELADAYWQRGVLLQKQGATMDALRDLRTALEKRPSRFEAWATIALCDQDLQKWDEAEHAWRSAIAGSDDVGEWHYRLGKLLRDHGSRAGIAAEMEKAVTLGERPGETKNAWLPDAHMLLAEALKSSPADKAKAIEHYTRFLQLAPIGNAYRKEAEQAILSLGGQLPSNQP